MTVTLTVTDMLLNIKVWQHLPCPSYRLVLHGDLQSLLPYVCNKIIAQNSTVELCSEVSALKITYASSTGNNAHQAWLMLGHTFLSDKINQPLVQFGSVCTEWQIQCLREMQLRVNIPFWWGWFCAMVDAKAIFHGLLTHPLQCTVSCCFASSFSFPPTWWPVLFHVVALADAN